MSDFFEKRAKSSTGHFFRDLPGRVTGSFYKEGQFGIPTPTAAPNDVDPAGAQMFGTGKGKEKKKPAEPKLNTGNLPPELAAMLQAEKKANESDITSLGMNETDPGPLPLGFHRPARTQPEALEDGAERFHTSENGTGGGIRHGVIEGGQIHAGALSQPQMKKTAADLRFMGTSFQKVSFPKQANDTVDNITDTASDYAGKAWEGGKSIANQIGSGTVDAVGRIGSGAKDAVGQIGSAAGQAIKNPWVDLALLGLAAKSTLGMAGRGARAIGRGAKSLAGIGKVEEKAPGLIERVVGGAKKWFGHKVP